MIDRVCSLLKMQKPAMNEGLLWASGTVVPTDATHGYQTGCLFLHTDGGSGTALYVNEGSLTSCDFNPVDAGDLDTVLQVGEFSSLTAGSGIPLSSTQTSAGVVYGDDNGLAITANVYNLRTRLLLTVDQSATSIRALMAQLKLKDGVDVATGIYTANQGYLELAGTHISKAGATLSCMDASLEIGTKLTVNENGEACGLHVETTGAGTITNNGTCAAVLIDKAAGAANWPYGVYVVGSTCHQAFVAGVQGTGVETTTTHPFAVEIHNEANADITAGDTGSSAGIYNRYEIAVAQTSQCNHISVFAKLRPKANMADGVHCGVYGLVEASGTIELSGTATTLTCAAHFALDFGANVTVSAGHVNGICIDSSINAGADLTSATLAAIRVKKSGTSQAWTTGLVIESDAATTGITLSGGSTGITITDVSDYAIDIVPSTALAGYFRMGQQDTGVSLSTTKPFAVEIHCEANVALEAGDTGSAAAIYARYAVEYDQTNNISHIGMFGKLRVKQDLADGNHAGLMGWVEISGTTEIGGIASTTTAAGNFSLIAESGLNLSTGHMNGVCVDCSIDDEATITGTLAGIRLKKSAGCLAWPTGIALEDSACTTGISIGTCTTGISIGAGCTNGIQQGAAAVSAGSGITVAAAAPTGFYFDDGGAAITAYREAMNIGLLLSTASESGTQTGMPSALHVYIDQRANYTGNVSNSMTAFWASYLVRNSSTLDGFDNKAVSAIQASVDIEAGSTVASGTTLAGISIGGNLPGTLSGKAVPLHLSPMNESWSAFMQLDESSVYQDAAATGGAKKYLKVYIGDTLYTIEMDTA